MISESLKLTHAMSIYMYLWGCIYGDIMGFFSWWNHWDFLQKKHGFSNRVHLEMGYIPGKWQFYEGKR